MKSSLLAGWAAGKSMGHYPSSARLKAGYGFEVTRNQLELLQRGLQVFHDFLGNHGRGGQVFPLP